jgi:YbbR domain-containing protein
VSDNFALKLAAVVLAIVMWAFVVSKGKSEVSMEVPIFFRDVPPGLQVAGNSKSVTVTISGHERFLRDLNPGEVHISIDLSGVEKGIHQFRIKRANVKLPAPFTLLNISPTAVNVRMEETLKKTLQVKPTVTGKPLKGFRMDGVEVVPAEVTVEGSMKEVRRLRSLGTDPVDITAASETVVSEVRIQKPGESVKADVEKVTVRVIIVEEGQ